MNWFRYREDAFINLDKVETIAVCSDTQQNEHYIRYILNSYYDPTEFRLNQNERWGKIHSTRREAIEELNKVMAIIMTNTNLAKTGSSSVGEK